MKKIPMFILFILSVTSCSLKRQICNDELSYSEIEQYDVFIRYCIDNINEIDFDDSTNEFNSGKNSIFFSSKDTVNKYFSGNHYNLCLHRISQNKDDDNNISGFIVYKTNDSDWKLLVDVSISIAYGTAFTVHIAYYKTCKFWKCDTKSPFY
jgi:hypothetical protein